MPADVDSMFSVRAMPWHREGVVLDDYPQSFEEARKLAGLDWDPIPLPAVRQMLTETELEGAYRGIILRSAARPVNATIEELKALQEKAFRPDPEFRRIAHSTDRHSLSYQRNSYTIIPNSVFGQIIDGITQAGEGKVRLETGGSLGRGRRVWMLARLDEPAQLPGDSSVTYPFLGLTSSHDGHASCAARLTTVRIVCGNTFSLAEAEGERTGAVYSFSHRGNWEDRVEEARKALGFAREEFRREIEVFAWLAGTKVTPEQERLFLREFIPEPPDGLMSDRVARNIREARSAVTAILGSATVEGAGIRGTAYGLVQAAGEYADHVREGRTWESRLNRSLLRNEPLKAKAAKLAREAALAA